MTRTLASLQTFLHEQQLDGWLLYDFRGSNPIALQMAGLRTSGSRRWFLWLPATGDPVWLIHAIEGSTFVNVTPELAGEQMRYVGWQELMAKLAAMLAGAKRIAMEYSPGNAIPYVSRVDAGTIEMVRAAAPVEIVTSADLVQLTQAVLNEAQMASHRRAAAGCLAAKEAGFAFIRAQLAGGHTLTEYTVQRHIMAHLAGNGLWADHDCIVAANAHAADPHYAPTAERNGLIQPGDAVLIDLWAKEQKTPLDCYADITWVGYCGSAVPARMAEIFTFVTAGRDAAVERVRRGLAEGEPVHGYEVDDACRDVIAAGGYGEAFIHRTGHSLGVEIHFNGVNIDNLETQDRRTLIPGVMFTVEPGIYLPALNFDGSPAAKGLGLRSEINCLMHAGRVEVTTLPLQQEVILLG